MNTFTINNTTYEIRMSKHADIRLIERKLDLYKIIGTILLLGEEKINAYRNTNKDIFIMDNDNNFSIVCYIRNYTIKIKTVIDKVDCFVRTGTDIVNL